MAIQSVNNNSQQNNLYALYSGAIAGTAGAFAGNYFAPRVAKNMDEFLHLDAENFSQTMGNMQSRNPELYLKNYPLISAKLAIEVPDIRLEQIFENDKISVAELKEATKYQEKHIKEVKTNANKFFKSLSNKKGKSITLAEYFEQLKNKKIMPENAIDIIAEDIKDTVGEERLKEKIKIDDKFLKSLKEKYNLSIKAEQENINFLNQLIKLEKEGFVYKEDAVAASKKQVKAELDNLITEIKKVVSYDSIKKYIPKKSAAKWAAITGIGAGVLTAGVVKLFGINKK